LAGSGISSVAAAREKGMAGSRVLRFVGACVLCLALVAGLVLLIKRVL
jgi:hypothetical protein